VDIAGWLRGLGLEQYERAFRENHIDTDLLRSLTAEDLREIGVTSVGHRRRLVDAINALLPDAITPRIAARDIPAGAERRQLTVMFCDLAGSTALSARLDPEDMRELLAGYRAAVIEGVAGFDGYIAKYMGDGVLVYFGYPQAHEDDAERAVRAGLALVERISRLQSGAGALAGRIGIATGLVVVGDLVGTGEAQERGVVGETLTSPPAYRSWLRQIASLSPRPRGGWSAISSSIAISALSRSKDWKRPSRSLRCCGQAPSTAASRRCARPR
jgi:class 3 adenylate cyclase